MKLRYKFVVQNVGGRPIAVAVGQDNEKFNGMIKLNASGELVFKMLSEGDYTQESLLSRFAAHFNVTEETAKPSVLAFIDELRQNGLLIE